MKETQGEAPAGWPSPAHARWALLVLTLVMGGALVATSVTSFISARAASHDVALASGQRLGLHIGSELRREEDWQAPCEWLLEDLSGQGLRYLAVVEIGGKILAEAGERVGPPLVLPRGLAAPDRRGPLFFETVGERIRGVMPFFSRMRRHRFFSRARPPGPPRRFILFEFEAVVARQVISRARRGLIVSLVSAAILLLAAAAVWRLSVRASRVEAQLARDRQLIALGRMSAVLGHELRNPLTSLKGHAQLLLERFPEGDPQRAGVETVVSEAQRLEELTTQVLDFARTGEIERSRQEVASLLRAVAERSGAAPLLLEIEGELPDWSLDPIRMEQVLENMLVNARQNSSPQQPVTLSAQVMRRKLVIEVRDRGEGLAPGDEEKVFEPFFTRRVRGTGLGLALARRIVEGHGGQIRASNHPEGGAVFRVTLPEG